MERAARAVVRHPGVVAGVLGLVTAVFAMYLPGIRLKTDTASLAPKDDPVIRELVETVEEFGSQEIVIVVLKGDVYTPEMLDTAQRLADRISGISGVEGALTPLDLRVVRGDESGLRISRVAERVPSTPDEVAAFRETLKSSRRGSEMVTDAGDAMAIFVTLAPDIMATTRAQRVAGEIERLVSQGKGVADEAYIVGEAYMGYCASQSMRRDLGMLLPVALVVVLVALYLGFGSASDVATLMASVVMSLVWTIGLMTALGYSITIVSMILPIILVSMGSAAGIHILNRFHERVRSGSASESPEDAVVKVVTELTSPVSMTSLTTAVGFASFVTSFVPPVREFGAFAAAGIMLNMLISLTWIPSILAIRVRRGITCIPGMRLHARMGVPGASLLGPHALRGPRTLRGRGVLLDSGVLPDSGMFADSGMLPEPRMLPDPRMISDPRILCRECRRLGEPREGSPSQPSPDGAPRSLLQRTLEAAGRCSASRPWTVVAVAALLAAAFALGIPGLQVETNLRQYFRDDSPVITGTRAVERYFGGTLRLSVLVDTGRQDGMKEPSVLRRMLELEERMASVGGLSGMSSLAGLVREVNQVLNGNDQAHYVIPDTPEAIAQELLLFTMQSGNSLDSIVSYDFRKGLVSSRIASLPTSALGEAVSRVEGLASEVFRGTSMTTAVVGVPKVLQRLVSRFMESQIRSLAFSAVGVWAAVSAIMGSGLCGALCLVALCISTAVNFGLMAYARIPLDVVTIMISGICIGVGVDYSIHLLSRYRLELAAGRDREDGLARAVGSTGRGIFFNAATLILGFGLLVFSRFRAISVFGILVAATMFTSALGALVVLPAVLKLIPADLVLRTAFARRPREKAAGV